MGDDTTTKYSRPRTTTLSNFLSDLAGIGATCCYHPSNMKYNGGRTSAC